MDYLVVILLIVILYVIIRNTRVKERFVRTLMSPNVLEVTKTGKQAKVIFQRNKQDKLKLGDTQENQKYEYLIFYIDADAPNQGIWVQRKIICDSDKCEFVLKNLSGKRYHMAIVETLNERISPVKKIIKFSNSEPYKLLKIKPAPSISAKDISEEEKRILGEETDFKDEPEINQEEEEEVSSPSPYIVCGNNPEVKNVESEGDMEDIEVRSKCVEDNEIGEIREKVERSLWNEFKKGYLTLDLNLVN